MNPPSIEMHYFAGIRSRGDFPQIVGAIRGITVEFKAVTNWMKEKANAPKGTLPWGKDESNGKILTSSTELVNYMANMDAPTQVLVTDDLQQELMRESNDDPIGLVSPILNLSSMEGENTVQFKLPMGEETFLKSLDDFLLKWSAEYNKAGTTFLSNEDVPGVGEIFLFHVLDVCLMKYPEHVKKHANLMAFFKAYIAVPGIRKFLDGRDKRGSIGRPGSLGRSTGVEPSMDLHKL